MKRSSRVTFNTAGKYLVGATLKDTNARKLCLRLNGTRDITESVGKLSVEAVFSFAEGDCLEAIALRQINGTLTELTNVDPVMTISRIC